MPKRFLRKGFSIIEVVVASIIFLIAAGGVLTTIAVTADSTISNERRTSAALWSQQILSELNKDVNSNIATGALSTGAHAVAANAKYPGLTAAYAVSVVGSNRKVDVTVTW